MRSAGRARSGLPRFVANASLSVILLGTVALAPASGTGDFRTIDGSQNCVIDPMRGSAGMPLMRATPTRYSDGVWLPGGADGPNPREISNAVCAQDEMVAAERGASAFLWQWGQFIDHDIGLTPQAHPTEHFDVEVPRGDPFFDPAGTGTQLMPLQRSAYDPATGTSRRNPRQQINAITTWIDASNVYGSDSSRAEALRRGDGGGRLRTGPGNLLPRNRDGFANAGGPGPRYFLAGDVRANEQIGLIALYTLFMREHNRMAKRIGRQDPHLSGDEIYERARAWVGALLQVITYEEFLPLLVGPQALHPYRGYDESIDATLANVFSCASFRFGHSMVSPVFLRIERNGREVPYGHLPLRDAFFTPEEITARRGIEPVLRGLAAQASQRVDTMIIDDLRNFLFGPPGAGGFDLAALNIQRGRDHGLPTYNEIRLAYGLRTVTTWAKISSDREVRTRLRAAYDSVDAIDPWIGGLAEDHAPEALVGELLQAVVADQFGRLRDGDRYWYQRVFSGAELRELERTRLVDVIRRNTKIGGEIRNDVFRVDR